MKLARSRALLAALLTLSAAADVWAQNGLTVPDVRPSVAEQSDAAYEAGRAWDAFTILERHLTRAPDDYRVLWRAARAALALGVESEARPAVRDDWVQRAIVFGESAVTAQPAGLEGRYWRLAAKGRMALHSGPRRTVSLARQVLVEAREVLAMDSLHAGAHNAVGRLNLEVMTLPGWKRALARLLAGAELRHTSWEHAERHLRRAAALDPGNILFQRDLGALHRHRDRPAEARLALGRALALPPGGAWDRFFQEEARMLLGEVAAQQEAQELR